jgi:hypothetical protein
MGCWFEDTVQLLITLMLLADLSVTVLMLLQFYWISLAPILSCRFECFEPRRASLSRVYALWNATSLSNIVSCAYIAILFGISSHRMCKANEKQ